MTICKHYVNGSCTKHNCRYQHIDHICRHHFFGTCRRTKCPLSHQYKFAKKQNTESFTPSHTQADMRIMWGESTDFDYRHDYGPRDVILVPHLLADVSVVGDVYTTLLDEMKQCQSEEVWKLWHGDTHWIADDHRKWKSMCPTFTIVVDKLQHYFRMDVKATRLNWYRDTSEWKPFHHDAAAVDEKKAKTQNMTIGISFGATRDVTFEHATTKTTVTIPLSNGITYGFGSQVNLNWRHGIPQEKEVKNEGRISIILWGWVNMNEK